MRKEDNFLKRKVNRLHQLLIENMKAIDIIEPCRSYYLLSNDKQSKPFFVGNRVKLEFALEGIPSDMIIATSGNKKRCIVLIDYDTEETKVLAQKADRAILKIKAKN